MYMYIYIHIGIIVIYHWILGYPILRQTHISRSGVLARSASVHNYEDLQGGNTERGEPTYDTTKNPSQLSHPPTFPSTLDLSQGDYLCVRYALARRDIFFYIMMLKTAWPSTRKPGSTLSGNPRDHEGFACYHFRTGRTAVAFWWLFFTSHLNLPPVARKCARLCKSQPSSKALPFDLAVAPSY